MWYVYPQEENSERKDALIFDLIEHLRSMNRRDSFIQHLTTGEKDRQGDGIIFMPNRSKKHDENFSIIAAHSEWESYLAWEITRIDFPGISIRISIAGRIAISSDSIFHFLDPRQGRRRREERRRRVRKMCRHVPTNFRASVDVRKVSRRQGLAAQIYRIMQSL